VPESYGAAVLFAVLGVSRRVLGLVPALSALGLLLLVHRTGAVLFGPGTGLLAMLFLTVVSPYVASHYVLARAYYVEHLLLGQVALLGAALWLARLDPGRAPLGEPARCRIAIAMGLAGGLGLYCGFQIVDALLPGALALLLVDPGLVRRRAAWLGVGALVLGSLPFWLYNLAHDWATFATGARFRSALTPGEAAQRLLLELLPVVLGMKAHPREPPLVPWPLAVLIPVIVTAAVGLLVVRVVAGARRLRRDPEAAGEALLVVAVVVTVGVVWVGRFVTTARYLVPLAPVLALVLARACQLLWQRARPAAAALAGVYLALVGTGLASELAVLWPAGRQAYGSERTADRALLTLLGQEGLTRVYAFGYWLAPRLMFDALGEGADTLVVAEPYGGRYPPHQRAVDASPRPAYVVRGEAERFRGWLAGARVTARHHRMESYDVFWDFTPPPPRDPALPRTALALHLGPGRGAPADLVDGDLASGWTSDPGAPGPARIDVELDRPRAVSGVTLLTDDPRRLPRDLVVRAGDGPVLHRAARMDVGGVVLAWRDGAPRVAPDRTLTLRFAPVEAHTVRLVDRGPGGPWAVAELFLHTPASAMPPEEAAARALVEEGRRLEREGQVGPALRRYREAMRRAPDAPDGYAELARLGPKAGLRGGDPAARAVRLARLGLGDDARAARAAVAATGRVYAELDALLARLAAEGGDVDGARRLQAEAEAARPASAAAAAVFGRTVELLAVELAPGPVRPGETLDVTYRWRLLAAPREPLVVYVHFRGTAGQPARFGDDHPLPPAIPELGLPQHVTERRQVVVPADLSPGRYRIVAGVWDPRSGHRLRRWWGPLPVLGPTVELGAVEVRPPLVR
jgi:4-amino-4-deoxy-L-arabinose transferase-like glycosyltransferase